LKNICRKSLDKNKKILYYGSAPINIIGNLGIQVAFGGFTVGLEQFLMNFGVWELNISWWRSFF
jgi:hypothetical protein